MALLQEAGLSAPALRLAVRWAQTAVLLAEVLRPSALEALEQQALGLPALELRAQQVLVLQTQNVLEQQERLGVVALDVAVQLRQVAVAHAAAVVSWWKLRSSVLRRACLQAHRRRSDRGGSLHDRLYAGRGQRVFHFHCFKNRECLLGFDAVTLGDRDADHTPWHR